MSKIRAKFPSVIFGLLKYSCALSFNAKVTEKVGGNSFFFENDYLHILFPTMIGFRWLSQYVSLPPLSFSIPSYISFVTDLSHYLLVFCSGSRLSSFMSLVPVAPPVYFSFHSLFF